MPDKKKIIVQLTFICWLLIVLPQIIELFAISKLVQPLHYECKVTPQSLIAGLSRADLFQATTALPRPLISYKWEREGCFSTSSSHASCLWPGED